MQALLLFALYISRRFQIVMLFSGGKMAFTYKELIKMARVPPGKKINLRKDFDPGFTAPGWSKETANKRLDEGIQQLADWQDKLYADDSYALLIVLQALDAAGKDGTIKHV